MKQLHIRREKGQWVLYNQLKDGVGQLVPHVPIRVCINYTPVVRAACWTDFKILVANWRKNHGY